MYMYRYIELTVYLYIFYNLIHSFKLNRLKGTKYIHVYRI